MLRELGSLVRIEVNKYRSAHDHCIKLRKLGNRAADVSSGFLFEDIARKGSRTEQLGKVVLAAAMAWLGVCHAGFADLGTLFVVVGHV